MEKRKEKILKIIIKEHIKTALPIGSEVLVNKYKLDISPATVRNEMAELEESGFIKQPHTSAGRIPTEAAYQYYLDNLSDIKLSVNEVKIFDKLLKEKTEFNLKQAAKALSRISRTAVFLAFDKDNLYYTGISNLFHQPEFSETSIIYDISNIIDHLEEIICKIWPDLPEGIKIFIGSKNPFSDYCSAIINKYKLSGKYSSFGIIGPLRMNYEKNLALMKYVGTKLMSK